MDDKRTSASHLEGKWGNPFPSRMRSRCMFNRWRSLSVIRGNPDLLSWEAGWTHTPPGKDPGKAKGKPFTGTRFGPEAPYARWIPNIQGIGATRTSRCEDPDPGAREGGSRGNPESKITRPTGAGELRKEYGATRIPDVDLLLTYDPSFSRIHGRKRPYPGQQWRGCLDFQDRKSVV